MTNRCLQTGEEDCPYCTGERCNKHPFGVCECDVIDRHEGIEPVEGERFNSQELKTPTKPGVNELALDRSIHKKIY